MRRDDPTSLTNPIENTSSPLTEGLNPRHGSDESFTNVVVDNEGAQEYELASVLSSSRRSTIKVVGNSDEGTLEAELYPEEITALYRWLPLKTKLHSWELSPSIHLLMVVQECLKHAHKERKSATSNSSTNIWDFHIQFINTLFPIFDALADLEGIINRDDKSIDDLLAVLNSYENKVDAIVSALISSQDNCIHHKHSEHYGKDVASFLEAIKKDLIKFQTSMFEKADKVEAFLSNYKIDSNIDPLGFLVVDQAKHVTTLLRRYRRAHEKSPGLYDYVEPPKDYKKIRILGDKLSFRSSLAFVRFSLAKPIPEGNIKILRFAGDNTEGVLPGQKQIVNLREFISESEINDFNALEKLLCAISGEKPLTVGYRGPFIAFSYVIALTIATFVEFAITFVRLVCSNIFLGVLASIVSLFVDAAKFLSAENTQSFSEYGEMARLFLLDLSDKKMQGTFHKYSLLGNLRRLRDKDQHEHHKALTHADIDVEHARILEDFSSKPKSSVGYIFASYLSASRVNDYITQGYRSFFSFIFSGMPEYLYEKFIRPCFAETETEDKFFERLILQSRSHLAKRSKQVNHVSEKLSLLVQVDAPEELNISALAISKASPDTLPKFPALCANPVGPSVSIIDSFELIFLEFSEFINGAFISHPAQSTSSEFVTLLAMSSFYVEWGGAVGESSRWLIDSLSKSFTGEEASVSDMRIMLGSFLFWKLGVVVLIFLNAASRLDPHFLEEIYGDPEEVLLVAAIFTSIGYGIHALPLLPETVNLLGLFEIDLLDSSLGFYFGMINFLIEEARVAAMEGQFPFNLLELFFIGLKAVIFLVAFVTGQHKPHLQEDLEKLKGLVQEINNLVSSEDKNKGRALVATKIIQLHDALGKPLDRKDARRLFDLLCEYDNDSTKSLRKGLYDQSIFGGSSNLLQMLSIYPFYPITLTVRTLTFALAKYLGAHSILHGLQKDFSAEAVMPVQFSVGPIENFRSAVLVFCQLTKNLSALFRVVASFVNSQFEFFLMDSFEVYNRSVLDQREWQDQIITVCKKGPAPLEIGYGVVSHFANTDEAHHEHDESHAESVEIVDVDAQPDVEIGLRKRPLTSCASAFTNCYSKTVGPCAKALEKSWQGGDVVNAMRGCRYRDGFGGFK
jgi:hypothetical protein